MPSPRITIRLSPELAARLTAQRGQGVPLSDIVRQALEAYIGGDVAPRPPRQTPLADVSDSLIQVSDTLSAIGARLEAVEQRLTALEAVSASVGHRQTSRQTACPTPPLEAPRDPVLAQIQRWQQEGMTLRAIAAKLNAEGVPTRSGQGKWYQSNLSRLLTRTAKRQAPQAARG